MRTHPYGQPLATHQVKTNYATFQLCAACVNAGHAGVKRSGNTLSRLKVDDVAMRCNCEHVEHFPKKGGQ